MKNIMNFITFIMIAAMIFSCSLEGVSVSPTDTSTSQTTVEEEKYCEINAAIMIPDYEELADSRAVSPQTYDILCQYNYGGQWIDAGNAVLIGKAQKESVANAPSGFPGKKVTVSFDKLPIRSYGAGKLRILLRDSNQKTLTSGTSTQGIKAIYGKKVSATFYAVPDKTDGLSGSLANKQMKFASITLNGGKSYTTKVSGTSNYYPDLVVFNESGEFVQYIPVSGTSSGLTEVTITVGKTGKYYLGIWAKNGAISSYGIQISDADALFVEDFEDESSQTVNKWINVSCTSQPQYVNKSTNSSYVHGGQQAYQFDGRVNQTSGMGFKITLNEEASMSFWYKCRMCTPNQSSNKAAYFSVTIDNSESKLPTTGTSWKQQQIKLTKGTHTIKFMTKNTYDNYSSGLNGAILDDIIINPIPSEPSFTDDFESGLNGSYWSGYDSGYVYTTRHYLGDFFYPLGVHRDVLYDSHDDGKVLCIKAGGSIKLQGISLPSAGALTFCYKAHSNKLDSVKVNIDNKDYTVPNIYYYRRWQKYTIPLSKGSHVIKFINNGSYNLGYAGMEADSHLYIDDVSIAEDTVESVEITPRGVQQTYIGGHTIAYKANALRSDGSILSGQSVTWSVTGGGTISSSGVFTPSAAGTWIVTAKIGSKKATSTVNVYSSNTSESIKIGSKTFTGPKSSTVTGDNLANLTENEATTFIFDTNAMPAKTKYSADGYVVIAGTQQKNKGALYTLIL